MSTHDAWTLSALGTLAARATIVLGAAWIGSRLAPRHSAATRHAFWVAGLATVLALPLLSGALPAWHLAVLPTDPPVTVQAPSQPATLDASIAAAPVPTVAADVMRGARHDAKATHGAQPALAVPAAATSFSPSLRWAWAAWALVAAIVILRYVLGLVTVRRLMRRAAPMTDAAWRDDVEVAVAALGLGAAPDVLRSSEISVPFTCGFLRPSLVMPESAGEWTAERRRVVLLHELAHVARRDCLVQALSHVACAVYWFHPLAWLAARRLRAERERACDDLVLQAGTRGAEYAQHLLDIARAATTGAPRLAGAALAMARPSELEGRLLAILDARRDRSRAHRRVVWQVAVLAAVVALPSATVQLVARDAVASVEPQDVASAMTVSQSAPATPESSRVETSTHHDEVTQEVERRSAHHVAIGVGHGIGGGVASGVAAGVASGIAGGVVEGVAEGVSSGVVGGLTTAMALHMAQALAPPADDDDQPAALPPTVLKGLTEALKDSDADVRRQALHALVRFRSPVAYDALTSALADSDPEVRQEAVFALGQLRDARAVQPLVGMLKDANPEVRQQAAFGLGQLRANEAVPALAGVLHDADADVRQQAIFALGQIGDSGSAPAIAGALSDQAADVRQQAAFALGQLGNPSVVAALTGALKDKEPEVREQAAFALGQIGDSSALEALTAALKDANADVRQQAIFAISQIASGHHHRPRAEQPPPPAAAPVSPAPRQAPAPAQAPQATPPPRAR